MNRIKLLAQSKLPTEFGLFEMCIFKDKKNSQEPIALIMGKLNIKKPILVRVHSACMTSETFHSLKCDCHDQLALSMNKIGKEGRGILIYLRQEGRGIGLVNKIKAYHLEDLGYDTVDANLELGLPADNRKYHLAVQILKYFKVKNIKLMTNNPAKISALEKAGIKVKERLVLEVKPSLLNRDYLKTKKNRMGHWLKNV